MTRSNTTTVLWDTLIGARLEELLFGLLHEMGAHDIVWRAGSINGVNATDGGRDIEATFDRPTPEGELDRERWWVESKGRSRTVEQTAVQSAALGVRPEVDILVIATNSRFPNGVRDWVESYQAAHPRPRIKLWDRDTLNRLVERYPLVIARIMPDALSKEDRISLLLERWESLGDVPAKLDREFFWEHQEAVLRHKNASLVLLMFAYAELIEGDLQKHQWLSIVNQDIALSCVMASYVQAPIRFSDGDLSRRSSEHLMKTMALLWIAAVRFLDRQELSTLTTSPTYALSSPDPGVDTVIREGGVAPLLENVKELLAPECTNDCARVTADFNNWGSFPQGEGFWQLFENCANLKDDSDLIIELRGVTCAVGFDLDTEDLPTHQCPLIKEDETDLTRLALELQQVTIFRKSYPTGQSRKYEHELRAIFQRMENGRQLFPENSVMDAAVRAYLDQDTDDAHPDS